MAMIGLDMSMPHPRPEDLRRLRGQKPILPSSDTTAPTSAIMDAEQQRQLDHQWLLGARKGNLAAMQQAKQQGANIHATTGTGWNAMRLAHFHQQQAVLDWLSELGFALPNLPNDSVRKSPTP